MGPERVIQNVSDTAWLVATLRAQESRRADALFKDPYAEILVGEKGVKMVESMSEGYDLSWFMAVRTLLIDQFLLQAVKERGVDCIINLAAGLCTRPFRLQLDPNLVWFDVDLRPVVHYKETKLADEKAHCKYVSYSCDLSVKEERARLWKEIRKNTKKALVLTEGLLLYLKEDNVIQLAQELFDQEAVAYWIADIYQSGDSSTTKWHKYMEESNATFRWSPARNDKYFDAYGWKLALKKNMVAEAEGLNRRPQDIDPSIFQKSMIFDSNTEQFWKNAEIWYMERGMNQKLL